MAIRYSADTVRTDKNAVKRFVIKREFVQLRRIRGRAHKVGIQPAVRQIKLIADMVDGIFHRTMRRVSPHLYPWSYHGSRNWSK